MQSRAIHIPLVSRIGLKISSKVLFLTLASTLIVIFVFYVYLVNKTVLNVVAREDIERDIASLSSTIGEQEFKFITLKNSVTLDLAHAKGFKDATPNSFIAREGSPSTLSYNSR